MKPETSRLLATMTSAIGALIMGLCGLCGGFFLIGGLWSAISDRQAGGYGVAMAIAALIIGGLPTAAGFGVFLIGRSWSARLDATHMGDDAQ